MQHPVPSKCGKYLLDRVKLDHTVTGESMRCTLLSSASISRALAQSAFTSLSLIISHLCNCSICLHEHTSHPHCNDNHCKYHTAL